MKRYKQYSFYWPQKTNFMNKPQEKKNTKKNSSEPFTVARKAETALQLFKSVLPHSRPHRAGNSLRLYQHDHLVQLD